MGWFLVTGLFTLLLIDYSTTLEFFDVNLKLKIDSEIDVYTQMLDIFVD